MKPNLLAAKRLWNLSHGWVGCAILIGMWSNWYLPNLSRFQVPIVLGMVAYSWGLRMRVAVLRSRTWGRWLLDVVCGSFCHGILVFAMMVLTLQFAFFLFDGSTFDLTFQTSVEGGAWELAFVMAVTLLAVVDLASFRRWISRFLAVGVGVSAVQACASPGIAAPTSLDHALFLVFVSVTLRLMGWVHRRYLEEGLVLVWPRRARPVRIPSLSGRGWPGMGEIEPGTVEESEMSGTGVCALCRDSGEPPEVACPTCGTSHHTTCWDFAGGCSVFGCR